MNYSDILKGLAEESRLRVIPDASPRRCVDLLSNDYMGLAAQAPDFREEYLDRFGDAEFTSAASRLLSRRQKYHQLLEQTLSTLYGRPALLFNSGYHANTGVIQALAVGNTLFVADKLIHASSIDGLRIAGKDFKRFPHNDVAALEKIVASHSDSHDRIIILLESIYSMDGDIAPLAEVIRLKERYDNVMIILDEAHAFGVRGKAGLGIAEETGLIDKVDVIIGTLGKAAASSGAFAIASEDLISLFVNTARSFIFSTALPPACCAWTLLMIEKLLNLESRRLHLAKLSANFVKDIEKATGVVSPSQSQIVPLIIGDAAKAMKLAAVCSDAGFDCMAIRRPTVPPHGERLRLSLHGLLQHDDLAPLASLLANHLS